MNTTLPWFAILFKSFKLFLCSFRYSSRFTPRLYLSRSVLASKISSYLHAQTIFAFPVLYVPCMSTLKLSWNGLNSPLSLYCTVLYCIVLYCIVLYWWFGHCCPMYCDLFKIYCAPPNLGITRTWICRLKFAQRPFLFLFFPTFFRLRFFIKPEISDSGHSA